MQLTLMRVFILGGVVISWIVAGSAAQAIDVDLKMDEAKKALAAGRAPMDGANNPDDVKKVLQQAAVSTRVGADPEKDPCGPNAVLRTKRYWLESFGRQEATESKKTKTRCAHAGRQNSKNIGHAESRNVHSALRR